MSTIRNRLLKMISSGSKFKIVTIAESKAGDICLYDKINKDYVIVSGKFKAKDFPDTNYSPVGVVVIPGSHASEIYGRVSCSIVSLVEMNCSTPSTGGTTSQSISWGPQSNVSLPDFSVVVYNDTGELRTNGFGYLSKNGLYNYSTLHIPDPYNSDMTRNPDYYNTTVSAQNAMSDLNGRSNTAVLTGIRGVKDYFTWLPTATTANDYSAASCCDMYYTEGTAQGQWYLPAAGEWGYIMSKWDIIRGSIDLIQNVYGNTYQLTNNTSYWTSTEHNTKNTRYVHTDNGMGHTTKTTAQKVRAMTIIEEALEFPVRLYTSQIDSDFYRRTADNLSLNLIYWYNKNCIVESNGSSYIPSDVLSGKIFIDDYEVTSLRYQRSLSKEYLVFETDYDYGFDTTMKVIQCHQTKAVLKGTIDVLQN